MAAPTSKVALCNLALDQLKQEADVSDIDTPTTKTEKICSRWYDFTRREVLRKHLWNFAKKRTTLTVSGTPPDHSYSDAYNLPNDYIRLAVIGKDDEADDWDVRFRYEIEDGQILIDNSAGNLTISYIYDHTTVAQFDPLFAKVLVLQLALNIAYKFTGQNTNVQRIAGLLEDEGFTAKGVDGQERPPKRYEKSRFISKRQRMQSATNSTKVDFS